MTFLYKLVKSGLNLMMMDDGCAKNDFMLKMRIKVGKFMLKNL